jgi:hypothetical protein
VVARGQAWCTGRHSGGQAGIAGTVAGRALLAKCVVAAAVAQAAAGGRRAVGGDGASDASLAVVGGV